MNSRERQREAITRAMDDVYRLHGGYMPKLPFDNPRQNGIYARSFQHIRGQYWEMEALREEMENVYGPESSCKPL